MPELPPPPGVGPAPDPERSVLARWARVSRRLSSTGAALGGLLALVVLLAVGWMAFAGPGSSPPPELELPTAGSAGDPGAGKLDASSGGPGGPSSVAGSAGQVVVVHVAGAVARPGVYRLAAESRFADALDAAGGPAADADADGINLAALLSDGERVYVPRRGEVPPAVLAAPSVGSSSSSSAGAPAQPIDLNTATAAALEELPGVGPSTAAAIVEYRQQQGSFRSVDELLEVRGIGEAKLAAIRPRVRVR